MRAKVVSRFAKVKVRAVVVVGSVQVSECSEAHTLSCAFCGSRELCGCYAPVASWW